MMLKVLVIQTANDLSDEMNCVDHLFGLARNTRLRTA
jgi:hypothetical protein